MPSEKESFVFEALRPSILSTSGVAILGTVGVCVALGIGYNSESQIDDKEPAETTCITVNTDTVPNELPYLDCDR